GRILKGAFSAFTLTAVLLLFFGKIGWASGVLGFALQSALAYFVLDGVARKGPLFTRVRQFVLGLSRWDVGIGLAAVRLFGLLLGMLGVFWMWAGFGLIGLGLAFAVRFGLDRPADEQRKAPLDACERLLRRLRMQALDEEELRQFVAKFAGRHW